MNNKQSRRFAHCTGHCNKSRCYVVRYVRTTLLILAAAAALSLMTRYPGTTAAAAPEDGSTSDVVAQQLLLVQQAKLAAEETLRRHEEQFGSGVSDPLISDVTSITATLQSLQEAVHTIRTSTQQRNKFIDQANKQQLQELVTALKSISVSAKAAAANAVNATNAATTIDSAANGSSVSVSDIQRILDLHGILDDSEKVLKAWVLQLIPPEMDYAEQSLISASAELVTSTTTTTAKASTSSSGVCVSAIQAAQEIHTALTQRATTSETSLPNDLSDDGEVSPSKNRVDYAAAIVPSYTSPTYDASTSVTTDNDDEAFLLSNKFDSWSRYVPQDWEEWFNQLYQFMKSSGVRFPSAIPDYFYHTLGLYHWARTAPPQAILQSSIYPGHCWPVAMKSASPGNYPQVTIRFSQPIWMDTIVIDHVSRSALKLLDTKDPNNILKSAPKRMNVYGYAPCDNTKPCRGLGFDPSTKKYLTEVLYDITEGIQNVQSFAIPLPKRQVSSTTSTSINDATMRLHMDESGEGSSSCSSVPLESEPPGSCGGAGASLLTTAVGAITVEIAENWGNSDYTCLYGVRAHGEPDQ